MKKNNKGITLIALVVTIIVLLILAGVSIAVLTGENGIINRTTEAKKTTEEAEVMEKIRLAFLNAQIGKYAGKNEDFAGVMQEELVKTLGTGATVTTKGDGFEVSYGDMKFDVSKTGAVSKIEGISIGTSLTLKIVDGTPEAAKPLTATLNGISGTVNWEITSGSDKISLSSTTGNTISVTPVSAGTATIKASCSGKEATCTVTVEAVNSVAITFDLNGGSVNSSTANIVVNELPGNSITLPVPTAPSATPNYKLKGWYDAATGGNLLISKSSTTIEAPSSNTTYYAQWDESLTYGAEANLGTVTVNNTALARGWQYFYNDGTNIYLIYENYLENAQIPNGTNISKNGYNVYASGNRNNLVNYLNDESTSTSGIWSGFAAGVQSALSAKGITATVKAKGAPTLEQFAGSYQANYPGDNFDVAYRQAGGYKNGENGSTVSAEGYVYKKGSNWGYSQSLGNSNKRLYFPETNTVKATGQTNDTYGYWLAGLSAYDSGCVCIARYLGDANYGSFSGDAFGVRPVVSIPISANLMSTLGLN